MQVLALGRGLVDRHLIGCVRQMSLHRGERLEACRLHRVHNDGAVLDMRLPLVVSNVALVETSPEAAATPGTARTRASVASLIGYVCEPLP